MAGEEEQYADQTLGQVLSFLQAHFPDAAEAVLKQLNQDLQGPQEEEEGGELADEEDGEPGADGASSSSGRGEHDGEHRAKSAEAVVTRCVGRGIDLKVDLLFTIAAHALIQSLLTYTGMMKTCSSRRRKRRCGAGRAPKRR
jgi:hypothetical protein